MIIYTQIYKVSVIRVVCIISYTVSDQFRDDLELKNAPQFRGAYFLDFCNTQIQDISLIKKHSTCIFLHTFDLEKIPHVKCDFKGMDQIPTHIHFQAPQQKALFVPRPPPLATLVVLCHSRVPSCT